MQFVVNGWLGDYVNFLEVNKEHVECILLDAQRSVRNKGHVFRRANHVTDWSETKFLYDLGRFPIATAGDVMYHKSMMDKFVPWKTGTGMTHEGSQSAEAEMHQRVLMALRSGTIIMSAVPQIPIAAAIYTDSRGTNARVRGNKRFGTYWRAEGDRYYKVWDRKDLLETVMFDWDLDEPISLESGLVVANGWDLPLDASGNWMKNPIDPRTAGPDDYVVLYDVSEPVVSVDDDYMNDWLNG